MKTTIVATMIVASLSCVAISAHANESTNNCPIAISLYSSFDVASGYILYGARQTKEPCYWSYAELDFNIYNVATIGASIWQNTDMTCRRKCEFKRMNEWDFSSFIRSSFAINDDVAINAEVGHIWYKYHHLAPATRDTYKTMMEVYARVSLENPIATPHFFIANDWKVTDGVFMIGGLRRDFNLPFNLTLTPNLIVGGGDKRYLNCLYPPWGYGNVHGGISFAQLSARLAYQISKNFGIHAEIAGVAIANQDIRDAIKNDNSDYANQFIWGSIGIDFSF